jgi:hypothetical protein
MTTFQQLSEAAVATGATLTGNESAADLFGIATKGELQYDTLPSGELRSQEGKTLSVDQALANWAGMGVPSSSDIQSGVSNLYSQLQNDVASSSFPQEYADSIRTAEAERLRLGKEQADILFKEEKGRILETGERSLGGIEAQTRLPGGTGSSGLGASTIRADILNSEQKRIDDSLRKLQRDYQGALQNMDFQSSERIKSAIRDEEDRHYKLRQQQFENTMAVANLGFRAREADRADVALDLNILSAIREIPEGQEIEINGSIFRGIKPAESFFSSGDIVRLMTETPEGTTRQIQDPGTGEIYNIVGIADPSSRLKTYTATDNAGNMSIISFDPTSGQIVGVAEAKGVGPARVGPGGGTGFEAAYRKGVDDLYRGVYNQRETGSAEGARERLIETLAARYPDQLRSDIEELIYYHIDDGYEQRQILGSGSVEGDTSADTDFYTNGIVGGESSYWNFDDNNNPVSVNWTAVPQALRADVQRKLEEQGFYDGGEESSGTGFKFQTTGGFLYDLINQ